MRRDDVGWRLCWELGFWSSVVVVYPKISQMTLMQRMGQKQLQVELAAPLTLLPDALAHYPLEIGADQQRKLRFKFKQLFQHHVIYHIAYDGLSQYIIEVIMLVDLLAEFRYAMFGLYAIHGAQSGTKGINQAPPFTALMKRSFP